VISCSTLGTLKFAGGETSKTFSVLIVDDVYVEGDETFNVLLSNPTGAALAVPNSAVVTITDNESLVAVAGPSTFVASLDGAHEVPSICH
jgi:hypothetical protein